MLQIISIGFTHVDPITATSAYADVDYIHYILLTVVYMPRQHCEMYVKLPRIMYMFNYCKLVQQLVIISYVLYVYCIFMYICACYVVVTHF